MSDLQRWPTSGSLCCLLCLLILLKSTRFKKLAEVCPPSLQSVRRWNKSLKMSKMNAKFQHLGVWFVQQTLRELEIEDDRYPPCWKNLNRKLIKRKRDQTSNEVKEWRDIAFAHVTQLFWLHLLFHSNSRPCKSRPPRQTTDPKTFNRNE